MKIRANVALVALQSRAGINDANDAGQVVSDPTRRQPLAMGQHATVGAQRKDTTPPETRQALS